jgi:hypothetical protein
MRQTLSLALLTLVACGPALAQTAPPAPTPALIAPEDGGAPGYQQQCAIPVKLDFVQPARAGRRPLSQRRLARQDGAGRLG